MSVYPGAIPSTGDLPDAGANLSSNPHSSLHDDVRDEVIAIATELGVEPSGTEATVRARLDAGLGLRQVLTFDTAGTSNFNKSSFPWLRAIRVRCQGGGGGGSATTRSNEDSSGGGGGGYAESFITDLSTVSDPITVTVGAGGSGGAGGTNDAGTAGGNSSFGSLVIGNGAFGGAGATGAGGAGGGGSGQIVARGGGGMGGGARAGGNGGSSHLGGGAESFGIFNSTFDGRAGGAFGGGGGGAHRLTSGNPAGGAGAQGIVIVELYA